MKKSTQKPAAAPGRPAVDSPDDARSGRTQNSDEMIVVGIGASAGGLDAMQKLLPGLPADAGMAYVVVQHMAPKYHSVLPSLLAKHTEMPVHSIENGIEVAPDAVYITPPDKHLVFSEDRLILKDAPAIGPKPSIDIFFKSLAEEKMAAAVGIILSGTGSDGALGIRAIKSNEGITMAQTADTARFGGMPTAAVNTGLVDLVMPPDKMGEGLQTAIHYPHLIAKVPVDRFLDEVGTILDLVNRETGIDYSEYKTSTVHRRISRRMAIHQLDEFVDYMELMQNNSEERVALSKDMLISVTGFFRDRDAFDALASRLGKLLKAKKQGDTFRAWVPGCATGEEAYSIAMLIAETLGDDACKYRFQIFATDIDDASVQLARRATYPVASVADMDPQLVKKYFTYQDHIVTVKKQIRDMVVLARQDLIKDTNFMHLDLISCRNLLIYINPGLQEKLLSLFHFSLNPNGILFLGKSETVGQRDDLFKTVHSRWKIFQRQDTSGKALPELMKGRPIAQLPIRRTNLLKQEDSCALREGVLLESLLGMMDCCAVITDEYANIHYIRGDVSVYFKLPSGLVRDNLNALEMARPKVRFGLQSLIHRTNKSGKSVNSEIINFDDDRQGVRIKVGPLQQGAQDGRLLIVFSPVEPLSSAVHPASQTDDLDRERMRELEQELSFTRSHLQDTIEELETSTEESQSLNEELQAANEELQATNEELETSNEELQASNEELHTVNDELKAKSDEAAELLGSLTNSERRYRRLVNNMNEALMLCEIEYGSDKRPTDIVIQQANRAFEALMAIKSRMLPLRAGAAKLEEMVSAEMLSRFDAIAAGGEPLRVELHLNALEKDLTLSIYNMGDGRLGVVCRDDTERKRGEEALTASERKYRELIEAANSIIIRWDHQGIIRFINDYGLRFFGYTADELLDQDVMTIVPKLEKSSGRDLDALVKDIVRNPDHHTYVPSENITKDNRTVWVAWTNKAILDQDGKVKEILAIGNDITALKDTESALRESEAKFRALFENNLNAIFMTQSDGAILSANPAASDMLGWSEQELQFIGRSKILDTGDAALPVDTEERQSKGRITGKKLTAIRRGGERFPVEVDSVILPGKPERSFVIWRDITDRENAEVALRESEAFLEKVLHTSVSGLYIYDIKRGANIFINPQYTHLTGYSLEQFEAMEENAFAALFHPDDTEHVVDHMQAVAQAADGQIVEVEYRFRKADGDWVWFLSYDTVFLRDDDGSVRQFIGTFVDITDRKRSEETLRESRDSLRAALAEKEVLLKEIHHRVKNNMQVISSLVSLKTDVIKDDATRNILKDISYRIRSMAMIHEKLYQTADLSNLDFADYAQTLLNFLWSSHAGEISGIRLKTDLEPISMTVNSAVPCGLMLNEMVSNALKHAFKGRDRGQVLVTLKKQGQRDIQMSVRDDGAGLPPGFDWRKANSLGLRLIDMLSSQIKATVDVTSDAGTEFRIAFREIES